tara:strand:- start:165 stop:392 length:228 start_codon:yes stop_codon:yes gene_type:complete
MLQNRIRIQVFHKYFTDTDIDITERIQDTRTILFTGEDALIEATAKANSLRSYCYPIYKLNENKRKVFAGYAVPR